MRKIMFFMVMSLMLVLFVYSSAQVPQMINYQGKLTKASGAVLDTTVQMVFSIYADSNGTTLKWTETQGAVKVEKGIFNVLLGNVNSIPDSVFDGSIRYLGVKVEADPEITPRKPMVSVAYAYKTVGVIGGSGTTNYLPKFTAATTLGNSVMYETGGNVGIGTTSPNEQLELTGNFRLPPSTASAGVIKSGANRFIHNFGTYNFFAGVNAGNLSLSGTGGNTGVGRDALQALTTGYYNTAVGYNALYSNSTGYNNTAVGRNALYSNTTTGSNNTAVGWNALYSNTTGNSNTAVGLNALNTNNTGTSNTAIGYMANVAATGMTNATAIGANAVVGASNALVLGGTGANAVNVGIGTSTPQGALDVVSTTGALIVPRMTTAQRNALTAVNGMIIYNTTDNQFNFYENGAWVTK